MRVDFLEKEFGSSRLRYATMLIGIWLQGTKFVERGFAFFREDDTAKWSEMINVIHAKILEYHNDVPLIALTLSSSGRMTREVNGSVLTHDFEGDSLRIGMLKLLPNDGEYIKTELIRSIIESKSAASVSKMVEATNAISSKKLQLPKGRDLIESKRGLGYRINPIYNLVIVK